MGRHVFRCGRGLAPLLGVLVLLLFGGCAGQSTARSASLVPSPSCFSDLRLFAPSPPPPRALSTALDPAILSRYRLFRRAALPTAGRVVRTLAPPTPTQLAAVSVGDLRAPISG